MKHDIRKDVLQPLRVGNIQKTSTGTQDSDSVSGRSTTSADVEPVQDLPETARWAQYHTTTHSGSASVAMLRVVEHLKCIW